MQIQISWLLQKPTDLDLHCLQRQGISGFSRTTVKKQLHKEEDLGKKVLNKVLKIIRHYCGSFFFLLFFRDGYSKCGLYCALSICCEQLQSEREVDIFNAVRIVKQNRPQLIPTVVCNVKVLYPVTL